MHNGYYGHCSFTYLCNTHLVHDGIHNLIVVTVVSTRQNILQSALLCYRSPVRPSVHPSVALVDQSKRLVKICNYHRIVAHTSSFCGISFVQKFWQISLSWASKFKQRWGGERSYFLALCVNISKTVRGSPK